MWDVMAEIQQLLYIKKRFGYFTASVGKHKERSQSLSKSYRERIKRRGKETNKM
jgi:hypothetical protein